MKRIACLTLAFLLLFVAGCAPAMETAGPGQTPEAALPQNPSPQPETPLPNPVSTLTPQSLFDELLSKGESSYASSVNTLTIAQILEAQGEMQFSARLRKDAALYGETWARLDADINYEGTFDDGANSVPFAAIFFNIFRNGYCLIMENRGGWQFAGYFPCGEVERAQDTINPDPAVRTFAAKTADKGPQTWLLVPGWVDSGTSRAAYDCAWYNLNSRHMDIRYITQNYYGMSGPLQYNITSTVNASAQFGPGVYPVEVVYDCKFAATCNDSWESENEHALLAQTKQSFIWEDGALKPEGGMGLYKQREVLADALMTLCWEQFFKLEKKGTKAEKAWAKQIRQLVDEQSAASITLAEPDGVKHIVGRHLGAAPVPDFEYWELNDTIECAGGTPIALSFIAPPDRGYTLKRYEESGGSEIVPIDNGIFYAQEKPGTLLYSLEGGWWFGRGRFNFNVRVTSEGRVASALGADMTSVLIRARDYAQKITGVDFSKASSTAVLNEWHTAYSYGTQADEWDVDLLWPDHNILANMRFELDGRMTFFALFTLGEQQGAFTELPLAPAPENVIALSAVDQTKRWFENLPIKRMGEVIKAELTKKDIRGGYNGRSEAKTKLRFDDGSVLTCYIDQDTGRFTYFCLYPKLNGGE